MRSHRAAITKTAPNPKKRFRDRVARITQPFAICLLGTLVCIGCNFKTSRPDLVIINGTEPESLDPAIITGFAEMRIAMALFEGLARPDPITGKPIPGLAERWEATDDGRVWTFYLRTNARWSTGEPISAEDVRQSWLRVLKQETAANYAALLFCVKGATEFYYGKTTNPETVGITVLNPTTLSIQLTKPVPYFLDICALPVASVVPWRVIQAQSDRWLKTRPLPTSGAFQLVHWKANHSIRLAKNPYYWDAENTQLNIVDILPIGSPSTALNLYLRGYADIIWDKDMIPPELLEELLQRPDFHKFDYLATYFIRFNVTKPPFNDSRVRKAFAMAIDKERIVTKITRAGERIANSFVPPQTANYIPAEGLPFDPARARRLLAEAGYPEGKGFPVVQYSFDAAARGAAKLNGKIAVELQNMWQNTLGVRVELRQLERKIFFSAQSQLDYDISRSSWVADYNDPSTFLELFTSYNGNNRTGWKNTTYDELVTAAAVEPDMEKRAQLYYQAETLLIKEDPPIVPLFYFTGVNVFDTNKVAGIHQNVLDLHPLNAIKKVTFTNILPSFTHKRTGQP